MKKSRPKTATVHHMTGEGATLREAKLDALAKVDAALAGSYDPVIVEHRGSVKLIWREPDGWRHATIVLCGVPETRMPGGKYYPADPDLDTARRKALFHLAQITWVPADLTDVPECVTDERDRRELVGYFMFQLAYRFGREERGMSDAEAHREACERAAEGARSYAEFIEARAENLGLNTHTRRCDECSAETGHCPNDHCLAHEPKRIDCIWCQAHLYAAARPAPPARETATRAA